MLYRSLVMYLIFRFVDCPRSSYQVSLSSFTVKYICIKTIPRLQPPHSAMSSSIGTLGHSPAHRRDKNQTVDIHCMGSGSSLVQRAQGVSRDIPFPRWRQTGLLQATPPVLL